MSHILHSALEPLLPERPITHIHRCINKSLRRQTPPPHKHENQASTKNQADKASQKQLRASNGSEASSIQGVGADWRSGPELCQALMMRWASSDGRREDGFFMELAINEKATRLQVIENMPEMMQLKKSNSIKRAKQTQAKWNKKRNHILQWSLRLMMLKKTTNNNALADV